MCGRRRLAMCIYLLIRVVYTCQIHPSASIGYPAHFGHGFGIVVGDHVVIGGYVNLTHHTTIASYSKIGSYFFMGPGAVITKPVVIGDHVFVGANAVVLQDIPSNVVAAGVPAVYKVIR